MSWVLHDFLNYLAWGSAAYLFYFGVFREKDEDLGDRLNDFRQMRRGISYIAVGILVMWCLVRLFDHYHH